MKLEPWETNSLVQKNQHDIDAELRRRQRNGKIARPNPPPYSPSAGRSANECHITDSTNKLDIALRTLRTALPESDA